MKRNPEKSSMACSAGLTLMEVVVALAVMAIALPLILSASVVAMRTRGHAEADTRSAWLARQIQRELWQAWSGQASPIFPRKPTVSVSAQEETAEILLFDREGNYLKRGELWDLREGTSENSAAYLVRLHAMLPPSSNSSAFDSNKLVLIELWVEHSARAPQHKRSAQSYRFLISNP